MDSAKLQLHGRGTRERLSQVLYTYPVRAPGHRPKAKQGGLSPFLGVPVLLVFVVFTCPPPGSDLQKRKPRTAVGSLSNCAEFLQERGCGGRLSRSLLRFALCGSVRLRSGFP